MDYNPVTEIDATGSPANSQKMDEDQRTPRNGGGETRRTPRIDVQREQHCRRNWGPWVFTAVVLIFLPGTWEPPGHGHTENEAQFAATIESTLHLTIKSANSCKEHSMRAEPSEAECSRGLVNKKTVIHTEGQ